MFSRLFFSALLIVVPGFSLASVSAASPVPGEVLSSVILKTFTVAAMDAELGDQRDYIGVPRCDVRLVDLTYATVGVHGEPATASAMLLLPEGKGCEGPYPLLGWARGTDTQRDSEQAQSLLKSGDSALLAFFAAQGYAVVATDYLGLGRSNYRFHPYLHAESEASAIVDALRAARRLSSQLQAPLSGKVMLAGYSQGGHAAMAAQRAIERDHADEFNLVATAPMSGPYSLSQTFLDSWSGSTAAGANTLAPYLLAYTLVGMQGVYGNIYSDPQQVFRQPWAAQLQTGFPGSLTIFQMLDKQSLPSSAQLDQLRQPAFTHAFVDDPKTPFRQALARNDLLDWTPRTPTVLCGSQRDGVVAFANSQAAEAAFRGRGAPVKLIDVSQRIPQDMDGVQVHTRAAAYLCLGAVRQQLFDPARS
jgi:pimeloyl-ACP methyl ester carboxylesterase